MSKKNVYFFGGGKADGNESMKNLLGGKGANLAEMAGHPKLKLPVPPGFSFRGSLAIAKRITVNCWWTGKYFANPYVSYLFYFISAPSLKVWLGLTCLVQP